MLDTTSQGEQRISQAMVNEGRANGFVKFQKEIIDNVEYQVLEVDSELVTDLALRRVIEFLYTGSVTIIDQDDMLTETINAANLFSLPKMAQFCQNIENQMEELNPSISTYMNEMAGQVSLTVLHF